MDIEDIKTDILDHYTKDTLLYLLALMGLEVKELSSKPEVCDFLIENLKNPVGFSRLLNKISPNAQIVLKHLVWEGISTLSYIDSKYHINTWIGDFYGNSSDPFIQRFKQTRYKEILLSTGLRTLFKSSMPMNIEYEDTNFNNENIIEGDKSTLNRIPVLYEYMNSNGVLSRELGMKPLVKDIKKIDQLNSFCNHNEIPSSQYLLKFLPLLLSSGTELKDLKKQFGQYLRGNLIDENIDFFIYYPHLKGLHKITNIDILLKRGRFSFSQLIKQSRGWINIQNAVKFLSLKEDTQIFDTSYFGSLIEVTHPEKKSLMQKEDNEEFLLKPMLTGIVTLLYSLGGVDLVFDKEITHFKLNEIGQYLVGKRDDLKIVTQNSSQPVFSKDRLFVYIDPLDSINRLIFNNISICFNKDYYRLDYKSFFRNLNSESEVFYYIEKIETLLDRNSNPVWDEFLTKISDRVNPIYNEQQLIVVNFPQNNSEFTHIILENEKIRKLFLMVEDFRGAFSTSNYKEFKRLLKEEGFII